MHCRHVLVASVGRRLVAVLVSLHEAPGTGWSEPGSGSLSCRLFLGGWIDVNQRVLTYPDPDRSASPHPEQRRLICPVVHGQFRKRACYPCSACTPVHRTNAPAHVGAVASVLAVHGINRL